MLDALVLALRFGTGSFEVDRQLNRPGRERRGY